LITKEQELIKRIVTTLLIITAILVVFTGCKTPLEQHLDKGNSYFDQEKWDQAIIEYTAAIEIDPENAQAYANRGAAFAEQSKYDLSLVDYNKALELDPQNAIVYYNRAIAYNYMGEYDKAIADCTKVIDELELKNNWVYFQRGIAYFAKNRFSDALNDFYSAKKQTSNEEFHKKVDQYIQRIDNISKGM
jgi:tetratricopeptide (TPR) repeat protein